jgi:Lon protease-like protein
MSNADIPLFPLGVVLFPGLPVPLHIFEERYKQMINECLEKEWVFGIVYYTGENFYRVGCTALITKMLKRFEDGRMNIVVEGRRRFTIRNILSDNPFLVGEVEFFDDEPEEGLEDIEALSRSATELYKDVLRLNPSDVNAPLPDQLAGKDLSFMIPANAGFTLAEKQAFLEMTSAKERLKKSSSALKRLVERIKTSKEIESLISGNGHVHNQTL